MSSPVLFSFGFQFLGCPKRPGWGSLGQTLVLLVRGMATPTAAPPGLLVVVCCRVRDDEGVEPAMEWIALGTLGSVVVVTLVLVVITAVSGRNRKE